MSIMKFESTIVCHSVPKHITPSDIEHKEHNLSMLGKGKHQERIELILNIYDQVPSELFRVRLDASIFQGSSITGVVICCVCPCRLFDWVSWMPIFGSPNSDSSSACDAVSLLFSIFLPESRFWFSQSGRAQLEIVRLYVYTEIPSNLSRKLAVLPHICWSHNPLVFPVSCQQQSRLDWSCDSHYPLRHQCINVNWSSGGMLAETQQF